MSPRPPHPCSPSRGSTRHLSTPAPDPPADVHSWLTQCPAADPHRLRRQRYHPVDTPCASPPVPRPSLPVPTAAAALRQSVEPSPPPATQTIAPFSGNRRSAARYIAPPRC